MSAIADETGADRSPAHEAFGSFVRSQRELARLSLRQAAELARISNPYLSQIEHGLALPSIKVLGALADALSVSVETLMRQAVGIGSSASRDGGPTIEDAIHLDARLSADQKRALLTVLVSFTSQPTTEPAPTNARKPPPTTTNTTSTKRTRTPNS